MSGCTVFSECGNNAEVVVIAFFALMLTIQFATGVLVEANPLVWIAGLFFLIPFTGLNLIAGILPLMAPLLVAGMILGVLPFYKQTLGPGFFLVVVGSAWILLMAA